MSELSGEWFLRLPPLDVSDAPEREQEADALPPDRCDVCYAADGEPHLPWCIGHAVVLP
jgi:hypothetical protein